MRIINIKRKRDIATLFPSFSAYFSSTQFFTRMGNLDSPQGHHLILINEETLEPLVGIEPTTY